jgi:hypothetical protein
MGPERTRQRQGDLSSLGDLLGGVYAHQQWKNQWRLFLLVRAWPTIVGTEVARLTAPAFFRDNTLWIYVQDSAWMHHLQFVKLDLLARINHAITGQPVIDLRWQLQPHQPPPPEQPPSHQPRSIDAKEEQSFQQMSTAVHNPECREALQRLWRGFAAHGQ